MCDLCFFGEQWTVSVAHLFTNKLHTRCPWAHCDRSELLPNRHQSHHHTCPTVRGISSQTLANPNPLSKTSQLLCYSQSSKHWEKWNAFVWLDLVCVNQKSLLGQFIVESHLKTQASRKCFALFETESASHFQNTHVCAFLSAMNSYVFWKPEAITCSDSSNSRCFPRPPVPLFWTTNFRLRSAGILSHSSFLPRFL